MQIVTAVTTVAPLAPYVLGQIQGQRAWHVSRQFGRSRHHGAVIAEDHPHLIPCIKLRLAPIVVDQVHDALIN